MKKIASDTCYFCYFTIKYNKTIKNKGEEYVFKEISTWVVTIAYKPNLKTGDICHTITLYDRDNHGSIIKKTRMTYYPNEDMSKPKEADETLRFQYKYDGHGNVIYEKNAENEEVKYEITYY